jgi:uncharacterized cupredoxin-like copper-binding protein
VALAIAGVSWGTAPAPGAVRTITIDIERSRFIPSRLEVEAGERARFVVRNRDPIDHELIVGPMPVQLRHESGREASHPPVPGEVSVPLFSTASTTYTFGAPGTVLLGCHLPRHWAYGMQGRVSVR